MTLSPAKCLPKPSSKSYRAQIELPKKQARRKKNQLAFTRKTEAQSSCLPLQLQLYNLEKQNYLFAKTQRELLSLPKIIQRNRVNIFAVNKIRSISIFAVNKIRSISIFPVNKIRSISIFPVNKNSNTPKLETCELMILKTYL